MRICGTVVRGQGRGRGLGFPTANLEPDAGQPSALPGIFAGFAFVEDHKEPYMCAVHIGPRPTFGEKELMVEAHLLEFDGNLYGKRLCLDIRQKLRDVEKFATMEALTQAIQKDCDDVRNFLHAKY